MKTNAKSIRFGVRCLVGAVLLAGTAPVAADADADAGGGEKGVAAREHRIRRMARSWTGRHVAMTMRDGGVLRGTYRGTGDGTLLVTSDAGEVQPAALKELRLVTLERNTSDLGFVAVIAIGVGALFAGAGTLGPGTDGPATAALAASGTLIGATIGWKTVYQDRTMAFE